ncbi:MAG: hypothetical protein OEW05_05450 [Candidatus Aminicenantes bacterium]|nr:hypothetical protein [Candidatus Aminicenantes bacterium]
MSSRTDSEKALGWAVNTVVIVSAVWLLAPFLTIDASDARHPNAYVYRLALGLMILLLYLGKLAFDILAPQGLARRVSNIKAVAVIVFGMLILGFLIYVVYQAGVLYLENSPPDPNVLF